MTIARPGTVRKNITLTEDIFNNLKEQSIREDRPESAIIRTALTMYFSEANKRKGLGMWAHPAYEDFK